jgi:hypothetical protein
MMRPRQIVAAFSALCGVLCIVQGARADASSEACSSAYTKGEEDRLAGRLYSAREAFKVCEEASCPVALAADCKQWKAEVEADLPTIRLKATNVQGAAIEHLQLFSDRVSVPEAALARPVILEAGPHVLRFEAAGYRAVEVETALRPSDREIEIAVVMHALDEPTPGAAKRGHRVPTLAVALAGVGVVALGSSLYFGLRSHNQYEDLRSKCSPHCAQSEADSVRSKALISDIALLTSGAAFGAAAWLFFSSTPDRPPVAALNLVPNARGAGLRLHFAF